MKLMRLGALSALLALSQLRAATAAAVVERADSFCSKVRSVVTKAHQQSAATAFCSSYLSIGTTTKCKTVTPSGVTTTISQITSCPANTATVTAALSTVTTTVSGSTMSTVTEGPSTVSSTSTVTVTSTTTVPLSCGSAIAKRNHPKPSCFSSYDGKPLSSACRCLSIASATATKTYTANPHKVTSTVTSIICSAFTVTTTPTVIVTVTKISTTTLPGTTITVAATDAPSTSIVLLTATGPIQLRATATPAGDSYDRQLASCAYHSEFDGSPCEFTDAQSSDEFVLNPDGTLHAVRFSGPGPVSISGGSSLPFVVYGINRPIPLRCAIQSSCELSCSAYEDNWIYRTQSVCIVQNQPVWNVGPSVASGCTPISVFAEIGPDPI